MKGAKLTVKVQPGARRNEVAGFEGDVLRLRVTAPPREGRANQAVVSLLSETLGIPKSAIKLVRGERSRDKVFAIEGATLDEIRRRVPRK